MKKWSITACSPSACWSLLTLLLIAGTLVADVVRTKDGRRLEGDVIADEGGYTVKMRFGAVRVSADEVLTIEKGSAPGLTALRPSTTRATASLPVNPFYS